MSIYCHYSGVPTTITKSDVAQHSVKNQAINFRNALSLCNIIIGITYLKLAVKIKTGRMLTNWYTGC